MTKNVIGFSNEFTLWECSEHDLFFEDAYGNKHKNGVLKKCKYIKNIGTDIDLVKQQHPNVEINVNLKGTKDQLFKSVDYSMVPHNIFLNGKYTGKTAEHVVGFDKNYIKWYAEQYMNEVSEYIKDKQLNK